MRRRPTDIFVRQLVGEADSLRLVLDRLAVDDGALELLDNGPMDGVALLLGCWSACVSGVNTEKGERAYKVFDRALVGAEDDGRRVVWHLALGLGVDSDEVQLLPPATSVSLLSVSKCGGPLSSPSNSPMPSTSEEPADSSRNTHMASINSSIFQPCSELIGTAFGIRYSRSNSSMLMLSILLST